jgi:protein-S-isoprenylcysteine O-methyltransferase Ste14
VTPRRAQILRGCFVLIKLGAALACVLPWVLCATNRAFPGRVPATLVFFLIAGEKVWSSLFRMPERVAVAPSRDWTAAAVAFAYLGVIFSVLADLHTRHVGFPSLTALGSGALVYFAGLGLKWTALRRLGKSWSIQLDQARASALVQSGPYRFIRHPIYLGAALDALGIALLFASAWGLVITVAVYVPALIFRARFEERCLGAELGPSYLAYERAVPGFIPRLTRARTVTTVR